MTARVMIGGNARDGFQAVVHDGDRVTAHEIAAPHAGAAERLAVALHETAVADGLGPAPIEARIASLEAWVAAVAHQFGTVWLPQHLDRIEGMVRPAAPVSAPIGAGPLTLSPIDQGRQARADGRDGTPPVFADPAETQAWRDGWDEADHDAGTSARTGASGPIPVHAIGDDQTRIADGFAAAHTSGEIVPPIVREPATAPA